VLTSTKDEAQKRNTATANKTCPHYLDTSVLTSMEDEAQKIFSADADNTCWHYLETSVLTSMEDDAQKSTQLMQMISARSNWKNVC